MVVPYASIASAVEGVAKLSFVIYTAWKDGPVILQRVSRELKSVYLLLQEIHVEAEEPSSTINRYGEHKKTQFQEVVTHIKPPLEFLCEKAQNYKQSDRRAWQRILIGGFAKDQIKDSLDEILHHVAYLQMLHLSLSDVQRYSRLDNSIDDFCQKEVEKEEAASTVFSFEEMDVNPDEWEDLWGILLPKLQQLHYASDDMQSHKKEILSYINYKTNVAREEHGLKGRRQLALEGKRADRNRAKEESASQASPSGTSTPSISPSSQEDAPQQQSSQQAQGTTSNVKNNNPAISAVQSQRAEAPLPAPASRGIRLQNSDLHPLKAQIQPTTSQPRLPRPQEARPFGRIDALPSQQQIVRAKAQQPVGLSLKPRLKNFFRRKQQKYTSPGIDTVLTPKPQDPPLFDQRREFSEGYSSTEMPFHSAYSTETPAVDPNSLEVTASSSLPIAHPVQNADMALPELWSRPIVESRGFFELVVPGEAEGTKYGDNCQVAAQGSRFAIWVESFRESDYGFMYRGVMDGGGSHKIQPSVLHSLDPPKYKPHNIQMEWRNLGSLAFLENGTLLAEFEYVQINYMYRRHFVVAWPSGVHSPISWKSAAWEVSYRGKSAFAHRGHLLAYQSKNSVNILRTTGIGPRGELQHIIELFTGNKPPAAQIVWSEDDRHLLLCHDTKCDEEERKTTIQIYGIQNGHLMSSIDFADLHSHNLEFHFGDSQEDILALRKHVFLYDTDKPCPTVLPALAKGSPIGPEFPFAVHINAISGEKELVSETVADESKDLYRMPSISPDRSCFLGRAAHSSGDSSQDDDSLYLFNILHPTISEARTLFSRSDRHSKLLCYKFVDSGHRILFLRKYCNYDAREPSGIYDRLYLHLLECGAAAWPDNHYGRDLR
ncbi:hypothetical protein AYL99_02446 [Fonsecaea erecta]|uniref:Uncharacterized protein n=1 Tax=Fonsecaea erecta TaxID=1367422 RepID=A0A178ZTW4_9EURO|nr:hypothetical protein AYL99_02446 [Fonsecaea erecta]OAP63219.1 hypothetical protein AYL99_02446 [Fonsecaea erecta]